MGGINDDLRKRMIHAMLDVVEIFEMSSDTSLQKGDAQRRKAEAET